MAKMMRNQIRQGDEFMRNGKRYLALSAQGASLLVAEFEGGRVDEEFPLIDLMDRDEELVEVEGRDIPTARKARRNCDI